MGTHGQSGIRKSSSKTFDKAWEFQQHQEEMSKLRAELLAAKDAAKAAQDLNSEAGNTITQLLAELADYESSGLTPEEVQDLAKAKAEWRLIELPCKVGDTVYFAHPGCQVSDAKVVGFWNADKWLQLQLSNGSTFTCWDGPEVYFGKTIFLTKEAAEAALGGERDER